MLQRRCREVPELAGNDSSTVHDLNAENADDSGYRMQGSSADKNTTAPRFRRLRGHAQLAGLRVGSAWMGLVACRLEWLCEYGRVHDVAFIFWGNRMRGFMGNFESGSCQDDGILAWQEHRIGVWNSLQKNEAHRKFLGTAFQICESPEMKVFFSRGPRGRIIVGKEVRFCAGGLA